MSRKVKSIKYTHYSLVPLKKLLSSQQIQQQRQQAKTAKFIQSILEDILQTTYQNITNKEIILQDSNSIYNQLEQSIEEYFYFANYSCHFQNFISEEQPLPIDAPEAQFHKKHVDLEQRKTQKKNTSRLKMHYQLQDFRKTIEKCKKERDLKKSCSNGSFVPLSQPSYRASQDNTEQIQQLLRRKKELFLQVSKSRSKAKSKVISTQRKEKKNYFQNDSGEATQMNFSQQTFKVNRLIPTNVKVHQGQCLALNLKKKAIVQFASTNKKSRRRIDRNLGDTCVLIQQLKENDFSIWSAVNKVYTGLKTLRVKDEDYNIVSALKLPTVR